MTKDLPHFSQLIHPCGVEKFRNQYWRKKHLYVKRDEKDYYNNILQISDLQELLDNENIPADLLRVFKGDVWKNSLDYSRIKSYESSSLLVTDNELLKELYSDGFSIEYNLNEQMVPRSTLFFKELLKEIKIPPVIKLFVSPPNASGIRTHFDDEDNFIVQIAGSKQWALSSAIYENPIKSMRHLLKQEHISEPFFKKSLQPGDLLYVPAGTIHEVKTLNEFSIHITIGFGTYKWSDLLHKFADYSTISSTFRKPIPDDFLNQDQKSSYLKSFKKLAKEMIDQADLEELLLIQHNVFSKNQPKEHASFFLKTRKIDTIQINSQLKRIHSNSFEHKTENGHFVIETDKKRIIFPSVFASTILTFLKEDQFLISDITSNLPKPMLLSMAKKLVNIKLFEIS